MFFITQFDMFLSVHDLNGQIWKVKTNAPQFCVIQQNP